MSALLRSRWVRIALPVVALVAGLLVGWLALGWGLFPVQWTNAMVQDLAPSEQQKYLDVVAESYTLNKNQPLAQERVGAFGAAEQSTLLADVETRVANRLRKTENILCSARTSGRGGSRGAPIRSW